MEQFLQITDHAGPVYDVLLDESRLLTSGADKYIVAWDKITGEQQPFACKLEKPAYKIFRKDNHLFVGQTDGKLTVINLDTNTEERVFDVHKKAIIDMVCFMGVLYVASQDGSISLWETSSLQFVRQLTLDGLRLRKLEIVPERNHLIVIGQSPVVRVLELDYLNEIATSKEICSDGLSSMFYNTDKEVLLIGDKHGIVSVLKYPSLEEVYSFAAHKSAVYGLELMGDKLITVSRDKSIKLWNYTDLSPIQKFTGKQGHRYSVNGLLVDNDRFYTWSDDSNILGFR